MRRLLDTHVALWAIAIKHALGRTGPTAMPVSASAALGWFESWSRRR
jgi:hypothetical protein